MSFEPLILELSDIFSDSSVSEANNLFNDMMLIPTCELEFRTAFEQNYQTKELGEFDKYYKDSTYRYQPLSNFVNCYVAEHKECESSKPEFIDICMDGLIVAAVRLYKKFKKDDDIYIIDSIKNFVTKYNLLAEDYTMAKADSLENEIYRNVVC